MRNPELGLLLCEAGLLDRHRVLAFPKGATRLSQGLFRAGPQCILRLRELHRRLRLGDRGFGKDGIRNGRIVICRSESNHPKSHRGYKHPTFETAHLFTTQVGLEQAR